jgi:hypothetical protein
LQRANTVAWLEELQEIKAMRNISFSLTTDQVKNRTKTVTRRHGWRFLKPGDVLCGAKKCMGLKPGEKMERLATIRVVDIRFEPLRAMTDDIKYGFSETNKEGFGDDPKLKWPSAFVEFFCGSHKDCTPDTEVTRIEFEYI